MGLIVVDNSARLPMFLPDEVDGYSRVVLRENVAGADLAAPSLCLVEFGNGILDVPQATCQPPNHTPACK